MSKATVPVPYMIALILAIVVIVVLIYMYLTNTGFFKNVATKAWCDTKKTEYCIKWSSISPDYSDSNRPSEDWNTFAPGCTEFNVNLPITSDCKVG